MSTGGGLKMVSGRSVCMNMKAVRVVPKTKLSIQSVHYNITPSLTIQNYQTTIISDKSTQMQDAKGKGISFEEAKPAEETVVSDLSLVIPDTESQTDRIGKIEHEVYLLIC